MGESGWDDDQERTRGGERKGKRETSGKNETTLDVNGI